MRGTKVERWCKNCGDVFYPREADVKRGWGKFCSKSCKAKRQEKLTGQYTSYIHKERRERHDDYRDVENDFHPHDPYSLGQE